MDSQGNLYIVAAPSGTGKTSLVKNLIDTLPKVTVSISHTTRPKRNSEENGVNYYFVKEHEFKKLRDQGEFLEHARIFDHYYGTSKRMVAETLSQGFDVILEIDWQGYQQIKKIFPDSFGIFILPPSFKELKERLIKRNQDHPDVVKKRLADAKETLSHIHEFDYILVNDDFVSALHDLKTIIESGRFLKKSQVRKLAKLIQDFTDG